MQRERRAATTVALALIVLSVPGLLSVARAVPPEMPGVLRAERPVAEAPPEPPKTGTANVTILGVNDFHGNLEPPYSVDGERVGGAAYLAAHLDEREAENPDGTIRVHAGDMVGASPLISSYFHDEPAVHAMNEMEFDVGTLGNHEFDEGGEEMLRLLNGGQRDDGKQFKENVDGDPVDTSGPGFGGASFPYVASNSLYRETGETVLPPYHIVERDGVEVGFVGVTTSETPNIVMPSAVDPFRYTDLSESVNRYAKVLQERGVETIVVLAHAGGSQEGGGQGEIFTEASQMTDAVDLIVAGHTHNYLNERVDGKLIVEANRYGTAFSSVDLAVDRASGQVVFSSVEMISTENDAVQPDGRISELVGDYGERVAPISERVVAEAASDVTRETTPGGESALGDLIADGQRAYAKSDLAFVATGGLRRDLAAGPVTYGELFAIQPFEDRLVKMELSGAEVEETLELQYRESRDYPLQVSGLGFTRNPGALAGSRVNSVTLADGTPLDPEATYTVVVEGFLAEGGTGFEPLEAGGNRENVGTDLDAFAAHVGGLPQPFKAPDPRQERRVSLEQ